MADVHSYDTQNQGPMSTSGSTEFRASSGESLLVELLQRDWLLPSGRSVEASVSEDGGEHVTIRGGDGTVQLQVLLTDAGPVLQFTAAEMHLQSAGKVAIQCEELDIHAKSRIRCQSDGDLHQVIAGDARTQVGGELVSHARSAEIVSARGDVQIRANDDVKLNGERVKLNC